MPLHPTSESCLPWVLPCPSQGSAVTVTVTKQGGDVGSKTGNTLIGGGIAGQLLLLTRPVSSPFSVTGVHPQNHLAPRLCSNVCFWRAQPGTCAASSLFLRQVAPGFHPMVGSRFREGSLCCKREKKVGWSGWWDCVSMTSSASSGLPTSYFPGEAGDLGFECAISQFLKVG